MQYSSWLEYAQHQSELHAAKKQRADAKAKQADMLACKPKIATERATSRGVQKQRLDVATSMNDILECAAGEGLMNDPIRRARFQYWSSVMNTVWKDGNV